ncbi:MAG: N-6 DNA methylase [Methanosphaera sp.]|nr:N-6 DNA methylase [Methanosphaera sp.]
MPCPDEIKKLVERFKENEYIYKDPKKFDEENTKIEFINPFFEALGWDVQNKNGNAPAYKDVEFEDKVKVGNKTKSPDYSFRIGGVTKFYVEAKKPSEDIEGSKEHAYQLRRYAWSAGLDLSILTDFEELSVYETNTKPEKQHASISRINTYRYTDYIDKWDEIADIFSKDAIMKGSFDNFIEGHEGIKKGTSEVDDEFLKEINNWRELLAKNIALRNKDLTVDELNYAVQLIIDRIIFLRIAEDRGIERYGKLEKLLNKKDIYSKFCEICKNADKIYNSGLFHFNKDKDEDNDFSVDNFTFDLTIDDKVFKEIFKNLYYPNCPYEFSVLPLETLGHVYEEFLGKTIRLTKTHKAKVEEKPEVKKAGGIFYTPTKVTKYIVENTVGKLIEGKTPSQISKIKILDPSCGSGSFLLSAYTYLLNYHLKYYIDLEKRPKDVIYEKRGKYYLTIRKKKEILKNNIYGVDIDPLAVEVTKLSLLLKVLEDQNKDELEQQRTLFSERALPNLSSNIKCGNSLVGLDVYTGEYDNVNEGNLKHPFSYEEEFTNITFEAEGGFDVVIGNPPYVRQESIKDMKPYLKDHYQLGTGVADLYVYFYEKSLNLLKKGGILGYICSNKYTRVKYGEKLRNHLSTNTTINSYNDCESNTFKAGVDTSIIILEKDKPKKNHQIKLNRNFEIKQIRLTNESWSMKPDYILKIKDKLLEKGKPLKELPITINYGIKTGYNKAFIINREIRNQLIKEDPKNKEIIKPVLRGRDIKQYHLNNSHLYLICTKNGINVKKEYPTIYEYLEQYKDKLKQRSDQGAHWTNLRNCKYYHEFEKPKIVYGEISEKSHFYHDINNYYGEATSFILTTDNFDLNYLTALFNSNVVCFLIKLSCSTLNKKGLRYKKIFMDELPIPVISPEKQEEIGKNTPIIQELYKQLEKAKTPQSKKELQQRIDVLIDESNEKVYDLFELTPEEIAIIEEEIEN